MAEGGLGAACQDSRHPAALSRHPCVAHCVDPAMKSMKPAVADAVSHLTVGKTQGIELRRCDHAVLAFGKRCDRLGPGVRDAFPVHMTGKTPSTPLRPQNLTIKEIQT